MCEDIDVVMVTDMSVNHFNIIEVLLDFVNTENNIFLKSKPTLSLCFIKINLNIFDYSPDLS